jgi:UPF0042 nucleotide-binding protein
MTRAAKKNLSGPRRVLVVTGLSGAGLSTALKGLEDLGYNAVDNIPLSLVTGLLKDRAGKARPLALGIDSRGWGFTPAGLLALMGRLRHDAGLRAELIFVNCQDNILQQRFTETRRTHPLAVDRPVADGVILERQRMTPVKRAADHVIDTSDLTAQELRRLLAGRFEQDGAPGLVISVMSFGFRNGLPRESDLVFDMRFLDNPHWNPRLRPLSGLDRPVAAHIRRAPGYRAFFTALTRLLGPLLPRYDHEGKRYLTISLGCTGGRHRSVFTAEELCRWLKAEGYTAAARHRDLVSWASRQGIATVAAEDSRPAKTRNKRAGESRLKRRKAS